MAFNPIPRSLASSSVNFFETPLLSLSLLARVLSTTAANSSSAADSASHYWDILRSNSSRPNVEGVLVRSRTKLDPSIVQSVIRRFPSSSSAAAADRLLALRFFVWAGLQPNHRHSAAAYGTASDFLQIPHHPQSLDRLLETYRADGSPVSLKTFKILLNLCRAAGIPDQALSLLRRIPEFGCRPDTPSYNAVLRLLVDSGRGEAGAALLEEMAKAGLRPDMVTYVAAVRGLCAAGRLEAARILVDQMRTNGCVLNVVIYSALLDGACGCGDLDTAMEILEEMERRVDDGCAPNVVTYTCLIKCLCNNGRVAEALGVFDRMVLQGCYPNQVTVAVLVNGFCADGRVGDAFELVERVVREGSISSEDCYSLLVVCLLRIGNMEESEGLVERMLAMGVRPNGSACNSFMRELCSRRRFLDGYHWFDKLEKELAGIDIDVYSLLLEGLCEEGYSTEAIVLGRKIVDRGIRVETACLNGVVEVLERIGEGDLASKLTRPMEP